LETFDMTRKWLAATVVLTLLLAAVGFGWMKWAGDQELDELRAIRGQVFGEQARNLSEGERQRVRSEFRERVERLDDSQRERLFEEGRQEFSRRIDRLLAMAPAERTAALDEMIDRMESFQQREGSRDGRRDGSPRTGGPNSRRGGGWANMTDAQRNERRARMLDRTSPDMRARFAELRRLISERRRERGLPERRGRGPFFSLASH
jgi:hypothetical protein